MRRSTPHFPILFTPALAVAVMGLGLALGPTPPERSHADIAGKPALLIRDAARELKQTHVTAFLGAPHAPGKNLVWCATFQIAWDQFGRDGEAIRMRNDPVMATELSAHPFPSEALDEASFVAVIGEGPRIIDRIKAALRQKFGGAASPSVLPSPSQIAEDDVVAYAYLFKNLAFETPFTKAPDGIAFGPRVGNAPSSSRGFGVYADTKDRRKVASQVTVWEYDAPDDFVIELHAQHAGDRVVIARLTPGETLRATAEAVLARIDADERHPGLRHDAVVSIPVLNFDITRSYDEITNIPVTTPDSRVLYFRSAMQNIRFRLDERGAVLKSDAALVGVTSSPVVKPEEPRRFICDGPFLILMLRPGATTPYFAAWIENTELLTPYSK